ncbi:Ferric siderophore transport system, periplasmic binding protein TonB [Pseudoalteromonas luteoviolacea B = ATCC 29581]|nr:Ferric siderophore transport system, periplasmic binding protein TonB [Pseudoalteromonas luteoviolacea B = ATCC 29581]
MLNWLFTQQLWLSLGLIGLLACERWLLPKLGAKCVLRLWLIIPLGVGLAFLPSQIAPPLHTDLGRFVVTTAHVPDTAWSVSLVWLYGFITGSLLLFVAWQHHRFASVIQPRFDGLYWRAKAISAPMLVGLVRPKLCIPEHFEQLFDHEQQQLVLAHEYTHLRRGDNQCSALMLLLCAINWFNPLVWFGFASFRRVQELACDEAVLSNKTAKERLSYCKALVQCLQTSHTPMLFSQYGDKTMIKQRLNHLRNNRLPSRTIQGALTGLLISAISFFALAGQQDDGAKKAVHSDVRPIMRIEPKYPKQAVSEKLEGFVQLEFSIDEKGKTHGIKVLKSHPQAIFDSVSIDALKQWTYTPNTNPNERFMVQLDYLLDHDNESPHKQQKMEQIKVIN